MFVIFKVLIKYVPVAKVPLTSIFHVLGQGVSITLTTRIRIIHISRNIL